MRKESAPNDETSLPQALQGREIARYLNRRFSIDCSDQLTGRSLVKVSSLERLHSQIAALAARIIMLSILSSPRGVACAARAGRSEASCSGLVICRIAVFPTKFP